MATKLWVSWAARLFLAKASKVGVLLNEWPFTGYFFHAITVVMQYNMENGRPLFDV